MKRVCIIGAGVSGLTALKSCLEENLFAICYEKTDTIGGLWKYRSEDVDGLASVMKSTIMNTSKEMSAFSDFPPPAKFANYMTNATVLSYLEKYAEKFGLYPHIRFLHDVVKVRKHDDFNHNGKWVVTINQSYQEHVELFDYVMVCTGHHVYPHIPEFPGLKDFQGSIVHTRSLKVPQVFEDKRVLVVGIGSSGGDAACDISTMASQVYLCARRGSWICSRLGNGGLPMDISVLTRFVHFLTQYMPWNLVNAYAEYVVNQRFDHWLYCLQPEHRFFAQHLMISDELPNRILSGRVIVKPDIHHFTERGVVFVDQPHEIPIDAVVMATGYDIRFPFLEDDVVPIHENSVSLYKFVFPPLLDPPSLAIIGLFQPFGSIFPVAEIQCRWVTRVFKKLCCLPSSAAMLEDIRIKHEDIHKKYVTSPRHTIQVDFISYMNEIASQIGAVPNLWRLFFRDPQLFFACVFGPCVPYQYRLNGPNAWQEAPGAILTVQKRIIAALRTCDVSRRASQYGHYLKPASIQTLLLLISVAVFFVCFLIMNA